MIVHLEGCPCVPELLSILGGPGVAQMVWVGLGSPLSFRASMHS